MKKLSLVLALVFAGCFVMAQKTIWLTQSGNSNTANLMQSDLVNGGYTQNTIFAVQSGNDNNLTSVQEGKINYLELTQTSTGNEAIMTQKSYDVTSAPGGNNTANINQGGISNYANLSQFEDQIYPAPPANLAYDNNVANTVQSGSQGVYILNQGKGPWSPMNTQNLDQTGNNNNAQLNQTGFKSVSSIDQIGNSNLGFLTQNGPSGGGEVDSYSTQSGSLNYLKIDQPGSPNLKYANSLQSGNSNQTDINQLLGWGLEQVVGQQTGSNNILNVVQTN